MHFISVLLYKLIVRRESKGCSIDAPAMLDRVLRISVLCICSLFLCSFVFHFLYAFLFTRFLCRPFSLLLPFSLTQFLCRPFSFPLPFSLTQFFCRPFSLLLPVSLSVLSSAIFSPSLCLSLPRSYNLRKLFPVRSLNANANTRRITRGIVIVRGG